MPPSTAIVSVFLPVGPCGQSAFAFLQLVSSKATAQSLELSRSSGNIQASGIRKLQLETGVGLGGGSLYSVAQAEMMTFAIYALSIIAALLMLGLGFFWLVIAFFTIFDMTVHGKIPFNMYVISPLF